jgi:MFS family permease
MLGAASTTLSYALLAVAHGRQWQIYVATALMGMGIGFAFASMANLIVAAVRPEETGVATGMNTIVRTIGGAVGSQISATIVVGFTEHDFTVAFALCAAAVGIGLLASLAVPRGDAAPGVASTMRADVDGDDRHEPRADPGRALRRGRPEDGRQLPQTGA